MFDQLLGLKHSTYSYGPHYTVDLWVAAVFRHGWDDDSIGWGLMWTIYPPWEPILHDCYDYQPDTAICATGLVQPPGSWAVTKRV